jgi:hypothetical protein
MPDSSSTLFALEPDCDYLSGDELERTHQLHAKRGIDGTEMLRSLVDSRPDIHKHSQIHDTADMDMKP